MANIHPTAAGIKPTSVYGYFDKVQVWLKEPVGRSIIAKLRGQCGHLHVDNGRARFGQGYRQRIEFKQPRDAVLRWIAEQDDAMVNRVEVALDFVFADVDQRDEAFEFLHRHLVRRWHGKRQKIRLVRGKRGGRAELVDEIEMGQTRYDAGRAANKIVFYRNKFSRITGELNCLHLEWHLNGLNATQNANVASGRELLNFNHRQFWKRRMVLVDVDPERLGRLIRNRVNGTKSRTAEIGKLGKRTVNMDMKGGGIVLRAYGTMQEILDQFGVSMRLHRVLLVIPNEALLPE